ncbi:MAG: tRNA (adenosine(37)-N6)-threonylcarbamoyltransferase complex transferase subunit TsaD [Myxococcota bacterium]
MTGLGGAPLVLGIESSCDEMAAAVLRDGREILSSCIHGQAHIHAPYGGVVPELASRDHVRVVSEIVDAALRAAGKSVSDLDGIAVTAGPGLVGSLLVGVSFSKALAYAEGLPLVGVHHLVGHLVAAEVAKPDLVPPYVGLVVSGGHTALYRVGESGEPSLLGETRDDAAGEAFDKVARLLGLAYPGGPAIAALAEQGDPAAIDLPRPMSRSAGLDFSYSGLKTAVSVELERRGGLAKISQALRADFAASFEAAVVESLVLRAVRAMRHEGLGRLSVVGGVAANLRLRDEIERAGDREGFEAVFPPMDLCIDNAVMIAAAGTRLLARGVRDDLSLDAFSRVPITHTPWRAAAAAADPPAS